jgi:tRNA U38,U39,U40 pseudouridine synthase TruA
MVGLVLAVMRGVAPDETIALALEPDRDVLTPMAPELGLFLVG